MGKMPINLAPNPQVMLWVLLWCYIGCTDGKARFSEFLLPVSRGTSVQLMLKF